MNDLDPTLLRFAERAVAQIPVPARTTPRSRRPSLATDLAVVTAAVALLVGGAFAGRLLNDARSGAATQPSSLQAPAAVTPPVRPTVVEGRRVAPLPNLIQNPKFGYNLTLPAWFHRSSDAEMTFTQTPGLLSIEIYTGRTAEEEAAMAGRQFRPWDLYIEVRERQGRSAEEWARSWYGCVPPSATSVTQTGGRPQAESACTLTDTVLRGAPGVIATFGGDTPGKAYLLERGDHLLVLRYAIGSESERPQDTSEAVLEQIITKVGLVPPVP